MTGALFWIIVLSHLLYSWSIIRMYRSIIGGLRYVKEKQECMSRKKNESEREAGLADLNQ